MRFVIAAAVLSTALLWGQDAPPADVSSGTQSSAGPDSDYGGPAVLTRGGPPSVGRAFSDISIRPFVTLNGIFDSGLATTSLNAEGRVPYVSGEGMQAMFGASGNRTWEHSDLGIDYRGSFQHYTQQTYYDGMDNSLDLHFRHALSSRTEIRLDENAARYQSAYSLPLGGTYGAGIGNYDPNYAGLTSNGFFDTPTTALMSTAHLVHQQTARFSYGFGASGFLVQRRTNALIGSKGYTAMGDVAYRLSRYQTISVEYQFSHYGFQHQFGQSDMHGASLAYSIRIGRHLEVAILGGGLRVESKRLDRIMFDPVIAKLLGQTYGYEKVHGVGYVPRVGVRVDRKFRESYVSLNYDRSVLSGNGVYATSTFENASLGYSSRGFRRFSFQAGVNYNRYSALTQSLGRYRSYSGGGGIGYSLTHGLSLLCRADTRRFYISNSQFNRWSNRVVVGLGWSPGEYPLALW